MSATVDTQSQVSAHKRRDMAVGVNLLQTQRQLLTPSESGKLRRTLGLRAARRMPRLRQFAGDDA
eukprot:6204979-Pleurochrysis_carterae.AAC.9